MKILQFQASNFKRIKVIDITPSGNVVVLSGKNGAGKSSVLDAIWDVLEHRAISKSLPNPLRKGEKSGYVTLDLGDYIATRTYTEEGSVLKVTTPDGNPVKSPQAILDSLKGDLSFDPWAFTRMKEDEQRKMLGDLLFRLTDGKVDLAEFDRRKQILFDSRTEMNREKKRLTSILTSFRPPTASESAEEVSVDDLTAAITSAMQALQERSKLVDREQSLLAKIASTQETIRQLQAQLARDEEEHRGIVTQLDQFPEIPDVAFLQGQLKDISSLNARARQVKEYITTKTALAELDTNIATINDKMELLEIEKAEALESSPLPVKGFTITPEGVQLLNSEGNMVPFCQASSAQRLRISLAIAMATNPKLKVIRVSDGSLLDDESMQIIREMTDDKDFQLWIEYASRNEFDKIGVYIEDGQVAELN